MKREFQKPLVVMSPKSLLRHPAATSRLEELTTGGFQEILDDPAAPANPTRLIVCSGKVYYDLADYRAKHQIADTALVRIEQLYPLNLRRLGEIAKKYAHAKLIWAQEESENMGAWSFIAPLLENTFHKRPVYAGRDASASPAVGSLGLHKLELAALLKQAFTI